MSFHEYEYSAKSCLFCGSNENVTDDHVPPQNLFPEPRLHMDRTQILCGTLVALGLIACAAAVALPLAFLYAPVPLSAFAQQCEGIQPGMSVEAVERLLGPGKPVEADELPCTPKGPVVNGDTFRRWESGSEQFIVGFWDGVVCSKWFWSPSL